MLVSLVATEKMYKLKLKKCSILCQINNSKISSIPLNFENAFENNRVVHQL